MVAAMPRWPVAAGEAGLLTTPSSCTAVRGRQAGGRGGSTTMDYSINLGTAGWGVWHSPDAGKSWVRHRAPFPLNSRIQALAVLPGEPQGLLAGGDTGLFASHDGGGSWERVGAPGALPTIWSLAVDPRDPETVFAGTRPAALYRSRNGG